MVAQTSAEKQPIIIKRKKIVKGEEHHGGAWKVAYADFVTAMMAFFLLMWLLNATTEEQRKGIADYFNPTIPISRISGGGSDALNGSSIFTEETYAKMGTGANRRETVDFPDERKVIKDAASEEAVAGNLQNLKDALSRESQQLSEHLLIKMSPEGIVLEIADSETTPLFQLGRSDPSETLTKLMGIIAGTFESFGNDIKIVGHTDGRRFRNDAMYDNWNLSADRANTARRMLMRNGIPHERIREVSGRADTDPLIPDDRYAAQNRRISITILTD